MVDDVDLSSYKLSAERRELAYTKFESGLQDWGGVIGLGTAIEWLSNLPRIARQSLAEFSREIYESLADNERVHLMNREPNSTMSFYVDGVDSHLLGEALS
jgi:selenocysteine lyase/cysteine desulfurase